MWLRHKPYATALFYNTYIHTYCMCLWLHSRYIYIYVMDQLYTVVEVSMQLLQKMCSTRISRIVLKLPKQGVPCCVAFSLLPISKSGLSDVSPHRSPMTCRGRMFFIARKESLWVGRLCHWFRVLMWTLIAETENTRPDDSQDSFMIRRRAVPAALRTPSIKKEKSP